MLPLTLSIFLLCKIPRFVDAIKKFNDTDCVHSIKVRVESISSRERMSSFTRLEMSLTECKMQSVVG